MYSTISPQDEPASLTTSPTDGAGLSPPANTASAAATSTAPGSTPVAVPVADPALFIVRVRELLAAIDETERRQLETDVLNLAVALQAAGMFEILHIAHPALATMVRDHLAETAEADVAV